MKKLIAASLVLSALPALSQNAHALDQIVRPYQSARSSAMGGVRMTTGLYDENFRGNPARVTANPTWRVSVFDLMAEGNSNLPDTISKLTGDGDVIQKIASTSGDNNHGRIQTAFPAFYIPAGDGKLAFAFGLLTSTQFDVAIREGFEVAPQAITDIGPALTVGRKFLDEDRLSVGMTGHFTYRLASTEPVTFLDVLNGKSISPKATGGQGAAIDFDIGATYQLPVAEGSPYRYSVAAAVNNVLGGDYGMIGLDPIQGMTGPSPRQNRAYSVGLVARRASWWKFTDKVVALEFSDIGNNPDGGLFRLFHLGSEIHYGLLAIRAGINQGYWTAGLGADFKFVTLDLTTYGEEMSLNPGGNEDRRYALKLAFQI